MRLVAYVVFVQQDRVILHGTILIPTELALSVIDVQFAIICKMHNAAILILFNQNEFNLCPHVNNFSVVIVVSGAGVTFLQDRRIICTLETKFIL